MRTLALLAAISMSSTTVAAQPREARSSAHERLALYTAGASITCTAASLLGLAAWQALEADRAEGLDRLGHEVTAGILAVASSLTGVVGLITLAVAISFDLGPRSLLRRGPVVSAYADPSGGGPRLRLDL